MSTLLYSAQMSGTSGFYTIRLLHGRRGLTAYPMGRLPMCFVLVVPAYINEPLMLMYGFIHHPSRMLMYYCRTSACPPG